MDHPPRQRRLAADGPPPVVLCLSGHDPVGGAGIQADIETLAALSCHAATAITALTVQDSANVYGILPQKPDDLRRQAETVLADVPVAAIKIGLIGTAALAEAIAQLIARHPDLPVVLDPVLAAGGGAALADEKLLQALRQHLLPLATVLTPNSLEARRLAGLEALEDCARWCLDKGCRHVLITGSHENRPDVVNTHYSPAAMARHGRPHHPIPLPAGEGDKDAAAFITMQQESFRWQRLPHEYHGSGCTLAAAVAGYLARGAAVSTAIREAQRFTWQALEAGFQPGQGQHLPCRWFMGKPA